MTTTLPVLLDPNGQPLALVAPESAVPAAGAARDRRLTVPQARLRSTIERLLYGGAGITTALAPYAHLGWRGLAGAAVFPVTLGWLWRRSRSEEARALLASCYKMVPALGYGLAYDVAVMLPGLRWWETAAIAAWTTASVRWSPVVRSRGVIRHSAHLAPTTGAGAPSDAAPLPGTYTERLQLMWRASTETGNTELVGIHQYDPAAPDFEAVILALPGQAVPNNLTGPGGVRVVAAVFDVPEYMVELAPLPGSGPGRHAVRVAPTLSAGQEVAAGIEGLWKEKVSCRGGAAPGMELIDHRFTEDGNGLVLLVEAAEGQLINLPRLRLARALGVADPDLLMVETDQMARGIVTIYQTHPLISIRSATVADLTMRADGTIAIGLRHDGVPVRIHLYSRELGALTDLTAGAPGAGKSVFLNTLLAAERISGIVSLVADSQNGMSLPEAKGRVHHWSAGIAEAAATLFATCALADYREQVSSANGWGGFKLGDPWPLVNFTWDEVNLVLGEQALVPPKFRQWCTGMTGRLQLTGRKFGVGARIAGQSIHVADLGDSEKIRANAKNGSTWLGRVNSSQTRGMAADMIADGTEITPIPRFFGGNAARISAAWDGIEVVTGPVTAGMAWLIQGGYACLMRVWAAVRGEDRTIQHLIDLYESAPIPRLTPEEDGVFQAAYVEGLAYAEALLADGAGGGGDEDGDEEDRPKGRRRKSKAPKPSAGVPAPTRTVRDLVLDALADCLEYRVAEIRQAVGVGTADGPSAGSVDNALSRLAAEGLVMNVAHGVWALAPEDLEGDEDEDEE